MNAGCQPSHAPSPKHLSLRGSGCGPRNLRGVRVSPDQPRGFLARSGLGMTRTLTVGLAVALTLGFALQAAAAERVTFKPVTAALLKMDGRQVKVWNVFAAHKKGHLILVQLGGRYLVLDTQEKEVLELAPDSLERKKDELRWERKEKTNAGAQRNAEKSAAQDGGAAAAAESAEHVVPSEEWVVRDAGRVRIIRVRLRDEGHVLEVQIPIAPDQRFY